MIRKKRSRGSIIIAALLLFIILLALGFGVMSGQTARMRGARAQVEGAQAREFAWAGWEDVRVKLGKDQFFPSPVVGQEFFAYSEDIHDFGNTEVLGTYTVIVDVRYELFLPEAGAEPRVYEPRGIYLITCVGKLGSRVNEPVAERELYFEVNMTTFDVIRMEDRGSL